MALELDPAARARGLLVFVATGQTGIAICGWGTAVDRLVADYVAGAAEQLVAGGRRPGRCSSDRGSGRALHPAYSGVTLGLLHGSLADVLVLGHRAGRTDRRLPRDADAAAAGV